MSREPTSGYDAFVVKTAFSWMEQVFRNNLLTKEDVVNALAQITDDEKIIPFPTGPRLAVDNTKGPEELTVTVVFWRDTQEEQEDGNHTRRSWQAEACFSKEDDAIRYIASKEGKEYRISWGYRTFKLDKPPE